MWTVSTTRADTDSADHTYGRTVGRPTRLWGSPTDCKAPPVSLWGSVLTGNTVPVASEQIMFCICAKAMFPCVTITATNRCSSKISAGLDYPEDMPLGSPVVPLEKTR